MLITAEATLRTILLTVCVGYWLAALQGLARAFVVASFGGDFVQACLICVAVLFHTLAVILLGAVFTQTLRPQKPPRKAIWKSC